MSRQDLDAWALALGASNDDEAVRLLGGWCAQVRRVADGSAKVCDELRGVDARGLAAKAASSASDALEVFVAARAAFVRHERGL